MSLVRQRARLISRLDRLERARKAPPSPPSSSLLWSAGIHLILGCGGLRFCVWYFSKMTGAAAAPSELAAGWAQALPWIENAMFVFALFAVGSFIAKHIQFALAPERRERSADRIEALRQELAELEGQIASGRV